MKKKMILLKHSICLLRAASILKSCDIPRDTLVHELSCAVTLFQQLWFLGSGTQVQSYIFVMTGSMKEKWERAITNSMEFWVNILMLWCTAAMCCNLLGSRHRLDEYFLGAHVQQTTKSLSQSHWVLCIYSASAHAPRSQRNGESVQIPEIPGQDGFD